MKTERKSNSYTFLNHILLVLFILVSTFFLFWLGHKIVDANGDIEKMYYKGCRPFFIISGSMEPTLQTNSLLIVKNDNYDTVKKGDIILFETVEYGLVIHRVVEITDKGFITKGDNNELPDSWYVTKTMYKAKVHSYYNGFAPIVTLLFGDFTSANLWHVTAGIVAIALFIALIVYCANWVYDYIFIPYFLKKESKKSIKSLKESYYPWMDKRMTDVELQEIVNQFDKKKNIFKRFLFRYRIMMWHRALIEEEKYVKKAEKRYKKMKGVFMDE